jgi:hypothetical protein
MKKKRAHRFFLAAGFCLGLNTMVRMANAAEAVLIFAVWAGIFITHGNEGRRAAVQDSAIDTLYCIAGWAAGFLVPYEAIGIQYGRNSYAMMVRTMLLMPGQATDYKFTSMLWQMFSDYAYGLLWFLPLGVCVLILTFAAGCKKVRSTDTVSGRILLCILKVTAVGSVIIWIRFCWGRGLFTYHYYEYRAVYYWAVLFIVITLILAVGCLLDRSTDGSIRVYALLVAVQIFITPMGSNNALYPVMNNLFMALPFTLWMCIMKAEKHAEDIRVFPVSCAVCGIMLMFAVQSAGFYFGFALQDGVWGSPRTAETSGSHKTAGIYTTQDNANQLDELYEFADKESFAGRSVIIYGDIPGVGYLLDMQPAVSTFWPSLRSYTVAEWKSDMANVVKRVQNSGQDGRPVIITSSAVASYIDDDGEGMNMFGVDSKEMETDEKLKGLIGFMHAYDYNETFCNGQFVIYE